MKGFCTMPIEARQLAKAGRVICSGVCKIQHAIVAFELSAEDAYTSFL